MKINNKMIYDRVVFNGPTLNIPGHLSFGQLFLERLRVYCNNGGGEKPALTNAATGVTTTFSTLLQNIVSIAIGLENLGVKQGDVIAFYGDRSSEYIAALMGVVCSGATATTFNVLSTRDELIHLLNLSRPRIIFCSEAILEHNLETLKETECIEYIIQLSGDAFPSPVVELKSVMVEGDVQTYEANATFKGDDTVLIFYSSGTTGAPKGVMITHINALYGCAALDYGYIQDNCFTILCILPWYHVFGLFTTIEYLSRHKHIVMINRFVPELYLNLIEIHKVDCLLLVPPLMVFLSKSSLVEKYDLSSIKGICCGAAPLSSDIIKETLKRMPNFQKMVEGYGLTEATLAVLRDVDELDAKKGLLPVPGNKAKIVDIKTGEKLGPMQEGEICIKSPTIMKGYVNNEAATREMFDEEDYMKTGDIGYYDEDGYFYVIDRLKEIIKYKGHQVAPTTIESILMLHNDVADCGVVGKPDVIAGEVPTAFVVPKPGVNLTEKQILEFTEKKLSPFSRLRGGVIFVDVIPKSRAGKILRRLLRKKLSEINEAYS